MMKVPELQHLESLFAAENPNLHQVDPLTVAGLTLNLRLESTKLLTWLKAYMDPVFSQPEVGEILSTFGLDFVYSDEVVQYAAQLIAQHGSDNTMHRSTQSQLEVLGLGENTYLLVEQNEGIAYLIDKSINQIKVAYSSKTRRPAKVLANVVVEVLIRFLEGQGYCIYHAGAFATERGAVVVCGRGGSGKTTLITAAMMAGARLIANERCFIKVDETGTYALGFPQTIFAGLGMATAFSGLEGFIQNPTALAGAQPRFKADRVLNTPPQDWGKLQDKLGFMVGEYCQAVNSSKPQLMGKVVGIIAPQIELPLAFSHFTSLTVIDQQKLMLKNTTSFERDKHFRFWLDLGFAPAEPHHLALGELPGLTMKYGIKNQGFAGLKAPLKKIYDALEQGGVR